MMSRNSETYCQVWCGWIFIYKAATSANCVGNKNSEANFPNKNRPYIKIPEAIASKQFVTEIGTLSNVPYRMAATVKRKKEIVNKIQNGRSVKKLIANRICTSINN